MCAEWANDFWAFVETVGERPEGHKLRRLDPDEPLSPTNWHWKETTASTDKAYYARKWRDNNPRRARNSDLKKSYGITIDDFERMDVEQNHLCKICQQPQSGRYENLAVDHCHTTGKVRGLLCDSCNRALGLFKDSVDVLRSAVDYLANQKS